MAKYKNIRLREFSYVVKALADRNRTRALYALRGGELCVCQITELLGLAPSTVSKHMSILKRANLVESRKEGRWIYYKLPGSGTSGIARKATAFARDSLAGDAQLVKDEKRLRKILKANPTDLCKRQCCGRKNVILTAETGNPS